MLSATARSISSQIRLHVALRLQVDLVTETTENTAPRRPPHSVELVTERRRTRLHVALSSRLISSRKWRRGSRYPPPQEAHVQNDGEHTQRCPGINTSHSSRETR